MTSIPPKPLPILDNGKKQIPVVWVPPIRTYVASGVTQDTEISYAYPDTKMWYFPMSMRHLRETGLIPTGVTYDNWLYYKVDLVGGVNTPEIKDYCHIETNYPDWNPYLHYKISEYVTYLGYDYYTLIDLPGTNLCPPDYPLWWRWVENSGTPVYMSGGTALFQDQYGGWDLVSSGGTVLSQGNVHRDGLIWRAEMIGLPVYYSISAAAVNTEHILNNKSFYVYRKEKCDQYSKWQLFWLNPHGGYDNFTFDKKIDIDYKIERSTYKRRTPVGGPTSFNSYFGGENIFNTNVREEITLRTSLLTQKESQLMIQLCQSPKVYVMKEYQYDTSDPSNLYKYATPYIIVTNEIKYEQKQNSKEVYYEVKIRPSNEKIIQSY